MFELFKYLKTNHFPKFGNVSLAFGEIALLSYHLLSFPKHKMQKYGKKKETMIRRVIQCVQSNREVLSQITNIGMAVLLIFAYPQAENT